MQTNKNTTTMIAAAAGIALQAARGIASAIKARKEANSARKALDANAAIQRGRFNSQLYNNYFDRADVQNQLRQSQDAIKEQSAIAESTGAVTGATPEAMAAQKAAQVNAISNMHAGVSADGQRFRDRAMEGLSNFENRYAEQMAAIHSNNARNNSVAMGNTLAGASQSAMNVAGQYFDRGNANESIAEQTFTPIRKDKQIY